MRTKLGLQSAIEGSLDFSSAQASILLSYGTMREVGEVSLIKPLAELVRAEEAITSVRMVSSAEREVASELDSEGANV